jgi:hypothetical protein
VRVIIFHLQKLVFSFSSMLFFAIFNLIFLYIHEHHMHYYKMTSVCLCFNCILSKISNWCKYTNGFRKKFKFKTELCLLRNILKKTLQTISIAIGSLHLLKTQFFSVEVKFCGGGGRKLSSERWGNPLQKHRCKILRGSGGQFKDGTGKKYY